MDEDLPGYRKTLLQKGDRVRVCVSALESARTREQIGHWLQFGTIGFIHGLKELLTLFLCFILVGSNRGMAGVSLSWHLSP